MNPESRLSWTTPMSALVAATAGGVILAVVAVLNNDPPGRLLIGLAAVLLLGLAGLGFRQRPRLSVVPGADPRLVVRSLTGPTEYRPDQILRARIVYYRRLGRRMPMLEIELIHNDAERLLIFGRWDLGTHPEDVYDVLVEQLRLSGDITRP
ncbi:PH domain-containing protein [Nocardia cyriacigeorgica]|uniref:PH domain-containing protein n=2 Tax=Nocardia cyriacigeorgica TaxID=135487 RepID=A0A5R8PMV2_9NOCA|nr:PH domain-containing protein [Nocardia cyriacigeorgica]